MPGGPATRIIPQEGQEGATVDFRQQEEADVYEADSLDPGMVARATLLALAYLAA
jgi:hypothetical protein